MKFLTITLFFFLLYSCYSNKIEDYWWKYSDHQKSNLSGDKIDSLRYALHLDVLFFDSTNIFEIKNNILFREKQPLGQIIEMDFIQPRITFVQHLTFDTISYVGK